MRSSGLMKYACDKPARYGVDKYTARFNSQMTAAQFEVFAAEAGYPVKVQGCSLPYSIAY
jgi:hypothetical protein